VAGLRRLCHLQLRVSAGLEPASLLVRPIRGYGHSAWTYSIGGIVIGLGEVSSGRTTPSQQECEPVSGEIQLAHLLAGDLFDGCVSLVSPGLHRLFMMIALGENMRRYMVAIQPKLNP